MTSDGIVKGGGEVRSLIESVNESDQKLMFEL